LATDFSLAHLFFDRGSLSLFLHWSSGFSCSPVIEHRICVLFCSLYGLPGNRYSDSYLFLMFFWINNCFSFRSIDPTLGLSSPFLEVLSVSGDSS